MILVFYEGTVFEAVSGQEWIIEVSDVKQAHHRWGFPRGRYSLIFALGQCLTEEDRAHSDKSDEIGDLYLTDA